LAINGRLLLLKIAGVSNASSWFGDHDYWGLGVLWLCVVGIMRPFGAWCQSFIALSLTSMVKYLSNITDIRASLS